MEHLQDENTYKRITNGRRNPTASTEKELNKLLQEIRTCTIEHGSDEEQLNNKQYYRLHSTDCTPASFYGLPKIHKPDIPLRPITSSIGSSTYELSKHLVAVISPLQNNKYSVKNSRVFADRIREQSLEPDEIFVSCDVISLFTCIPTHLALRITSERLLQDPTLCERTNLSSDNVMRLLEFVLNNIYFTFQGTHYQQVFGCPMGSPISAILANLVMEHIEERALATAPHPPKWWYRYVDDSHACIHKQFIEEFHAHLNSIDPHVQFTYEVEQEGAISFLDTKTTRRTDGSIVVTVYRKPTNTDKYLDFDSHHHVQHKRAVARTLLDRATSIPSTDEEKTAEVQRVTATLKANGYPARFIDSCKSRKPRERQGNQAVTRNLVVLPYAKGASEKITRVLNQHNIKVAHKPIRTVGSFFKRPKDQRKKEDTRGTVYKIKCNDCDAVYIGQSSRALKTRTKEHSKAAACFDKNSQLAQHSQKTGHSFDFKNVSILHVCPRWNQRLFLEAWYSNKEENSINEHVEFPRVYLNLKNF